MVTAITNGIKVSVDTGYSEGHSKPEYRHFVYYYTITIENNSDRAIQLLRRHWFITDSDGTVREVEGEGVVGEKPVLKPGESYKYTSGCNLHTDIGKMHGTYLMCDQEDQHFFYVDIPHFTLQTPYKLN